MERTPTLLLSLALFCTPFAPAGAQRLTIFNAAALGPPFRALLADLRAQGTIAEADQQNSPSLEAVRKLTDLGKVPDLLAVADVSLLDSLVLPRFSSWYLAFGTNALVLAYGPQSLQAAEITPTNWVDILLRPGVRTGRSDPRVDPSGYRTLMAAELAERFYRRPGLAARLRAAMPERYVRHAEADLSALVEAGELDYIWTYRNLAKAHGLRWVELPPEVNLESPRLAAWYQQVEVTLPRSAGTGALRLRGTPIAFALTIPRTASQPELAEQFVRLLLSPAGRALMERSGFTMLARPLLVGSGAPSVAQQVSAP
jgi:molybdate/tungstate transport system substrate-binding protein